MFATSAVQILPILPLLITLTGCRPLFAAAANEAMTDDLLRAAENHDTVKIKDLLQHGADVNCHGINGYFPLEMAMSRADLDLVKLLLDRGARIDTTNDFGETALAAAAGMDEDYLPIVQLLLDRGADVNAGHGAALEHACSHGTPKVVKLLLAHGARLDAVDADGNSVLMTAAQGPSLETFQALVDAGAPVNATNKTGETVLMRVAAAKTQSPQVGAAILKLLLDRHVNVNAADHEGRTALAAAVGEYFSEAGGHLASPEVVRTLLERGADPNLKLKGGATALMVAADVFRERTDIVSLLLAQGADVNAADDTGKTALMIAAEKGHPDIVKLLLDHRAGINAEDRTGRTAILQAADGGHPEIVRLLLERGAAVDTPHGETAAALIRRAQNAALVKAAGRNDLDAVRKLLTTGADILGRDRGGATALLAAAGSYWESTEMAQFLLEKGADVNAHDQQGFTPLIKAAEERRPELVRLLLNRGANPNAATVDGTTALMLACRYAKHESVKMLLDKGADVNARDKDGRTAFLKAAEADYVDTEKLMQMLLAKGADANATDLAGKNALLLAVEAGTAELLQFLLDHHVDPNVRDKAGETPLKIARQRQRPDLVEILVKAGARE